MFRIRRLTRYVWSEVTVLSLWGLLFWTFILLMNTLFFVAEKAITMGLGWELTFRLFVLEIPRLLVMSIPIGVLFGTMMAVGRISADSEWVAMQSVGLGLRGLLRPVLLHGFIAFAVTWGVFAYLFPESNFAARSMQPELIFSRNMAANLKPRVFYTDLPGVGLYVSNIRPGRSGAGRLEGVLLYRAEGPGGYHELTISRNGDLYPAADGSGGLEIELNKGVQYFYHPDAPADGRIHAFGSLHPEPLDPPAYLKNLRGPQRTVSDMVFPALIDELGRAQSQEDTVLRRLRLRGIWMEIHRRFAVPLAAMLFAILAVPLGITQVRSGKGAAFAVSIVVIVVYWLVFSAAQEQAAYDVIPPFAGMWAANAVTVLWIAAAFWWFRRSRGQPLGLVSRLLASLAWIGRKIRRAPKDRAADAGTNEVDGAPPPPPTTTIRLISLIDRHIAKGFLRILIMALVSTFAVYGIVEIKGLLDELIRNKLPLSLIATFFKYVTPGMINLVLPISCLVAAVLTFTGMARNGELTAVMANGLSLRRASVPVLAITLLACAVYFLIQDRVAPITNQRAQEIKDQIHGRKPRSYGAGIGGRWTIGDEGRLYHYRVFDPVDQEFKGLHVFTVNRDELRVVDHLYTSEATWDGSEWTLGDGWFREFGSGGMPKSESFEDFEAGRTAPFDPPENFEQRERTLSAQDSLADQMSLEDLRAQINSLNDSGYDATRLEVAWWAKLAQPATPLVMVILGLPFAFRIGRRGSLYGVGVALLLVIVYWAAFAVFRALGFETFLPPFLAAWAPNILFTLLGLYLILYIRT